MKGYGPDAGARSPRFAGINTFLRLPHVTQFDGVDAAVLGLAFDTGLAVRSGARFGPRAIREASLTIRAAYNPAQRVAVFERLSAVDSGDAPLVAGLHRPLSTHGETLARSTGPARCRWASAATTPSCWPSCAPRRRSTARWPCSLRRSHGHLDEDFGEQHTHGTSSGAPSRRV